MNHEQTWTRKTHQGPDLGEAITFPLIVYFVPFHEAHIQMAFCSSTPKWESRNCQSWDSRNFDSKTLIGYQFDDVLKPIIKFYLYIYIYIYIDVSFKFKFMISKNSLNLHYFHKGH